MSSRAILATALLLVVAGCAGPLPAGTPDTGPQSPTMTPYPNETVAFPEGPKERPAMPDTLTADTAAAYAVRHEFRYRYNALWEGPDTEIGFSTESCSVESSTQVASGFEVVVRCVGYVNKPGSGNQSTVHYDLAPWTVRYYIDGNSILREELG